MELKLDNVQKTCMDIAREAQSHCKNLTIHFVIHHEGQRLDALSTSAQELIGHPAGETAMQFLQKPGRSELSNILGTAVARENIFLGLTTKDHFLALCALNIDHFDIFLQAKLHAYHLAWHVLDIINYYRKDVGESFLDSEIIYRDRNVIQAATANLKADIFATAMCSFKKDIGAIKAMAKLRGNASMERITYNCPENFPFPIAIDTVEELFSKFNFDRCPKKQRLKSALKLAHQISLAYDQEALIQWPAFCEPAQDMTWRGMDKSRIIAAALNTSSNTHVRTIAYILEEVLEITPSPIEKIHDTYSPFADLRLNEKLHNKIIDTICQDVIAQGISQNSAMPMIKKANEQNTELTFGQTLGWCASALQAAARAFDAAKKNGTDAPAAAKQEFLEQRERVSWADIERVGQRVIKKQRAGQNVTLSEVRKLSEDIKSLESLKKSVEKTISDPAYQHKLAAAAELNNTQGLQPVGITPSQGAKPKAAAYEVAPSIPAFGNNALGARTTTRTQPPQSDKEEKQREEHTE